MRTGDSSDSLRTSFGKLLVLCYEPVGEKFVMPGALTNRRQIVVKLEFDC